MPQHWQFTCRMPWTKNVARPSTGASWKRRGCNRSQPWAGSRCPSKRRDRWPERAPRLPAGHARPRSPPAGSSRTRNRAACRPGSRRCAVPSSPSRGGPQHPRLTSLQRPARPHHRPAHAPNLRYCKEEKLALGPQTARKIHNCKGLSWQSASVPKRSLAGDESSLRIDGGRPSSSRTPDAYCWRNQQHTRGPDRRLRRLNAPNSSVVTSRRSS